MLMDGQWAALEPLIETCRPPARVAPQNLRQTMSAIMWRHQNGAKWRAVPEVLGRWWKAAQTFIRWSRLGVWERLLLLAQKGRVELGMTFLDGTNIRAHQKAAGAPRKRIHPHSETSVKYSLRLEDYSRILRATLSQQRSSDTVAKCGPVCDVGGGL